MDTNIEQEKIVTEILKKLKAKKNRVELLAEEEINEIKQQLELISDRTQKEAALGRENLEYIENGFFPEVAIHSIPGVSLDIENMPEIIEGRPQVFLLGSAGSGKTSLLSAFVHYAFKYKEAFSDKTHNPFGFNYVNALNWAIDRNRLIGRNKGTDIQFFTMDLKNGKRKLPYSFYEMSGENFLNIVNSLRDNPDEGIGQLHPKLQKHIFQSANPKIIFLILDYEQAEQADDLGNNQGIILNSILADLDSYDVIKSTRAIIPMFTKWDKATQNLSPMEYFKENFYTLNTYIMRLLEKNKNLFFDVLSFSLGTFADGEILSANGEIIQNKKFSFKPDGAQKIYDLLSNKNFYKNLK